MRTISPQTRLRGAGSGEKTGYDPKKGNVRDQIRDTLAALAGLWQGEPAPLRARTRRTGDPERIACSSRGRACVLLQRKKTGGDFFLEGFRQQRPVMHVNENRDVAFAECRSETLDRRAGLPERAGSTDDKIKVASRMGLSRQAAAVCPDLRAGNEGAEQIAYRFPDRRFEKKLIPFHRLRPVARPVPAHRL